MKNYEQKQNWKGSALLAPVPPTLITCEHEGKKNIFTVAWTGIVCTRPAMTYISVRPERYSYDIIKNSESFVINLATTELVKAVDFCGVRSGKDINKFEKFGFTTTPAKTVDAPVLDQSPVNIECKVTQIIPLGTHDMFMAQIMSVNVAEEILDKNGRLALEKANLLAYSHGQYFAMGKQLGSFGFSVKKKARKSSKNNKKR